MTFFVTHCVIRSGATNDAMTIAVLSAGGTEDGSPLLRSYPAAYATGRISTNTSISARKPPRIARSQRMSGHFSRRGEQSFEEGAKLSRPIKVLRVPLHADAEPLARVLDGFDDTVGCRRRDDESAPHLLHRLMMTTVHRAGVAVNPLAQQLVEQGALGDPDVVGDGERRVAHLMGERFRQLTRDVLHQGAAAGNVQHLDAPADPKQRDISVARALCQLELEAVAAGFGRFER